MRRTLIQPETIGIGISYSCVCAQWIVDCGYCRVLVCSVDSEFRGFRAWGNDVLYAGKYSCRMIYGWKFGRVIALFGAV